MDSFRAEHRRKNTKCSVWAKAGDSDDTSAVHPFWITWKRTTHCQFSGFLVSSRGQGKEVSFCVVDILLSG